MATPMETADTIIDIGGALVLKAPLSLLAAHHPVAHIQQDARLADYRQVINFTLQTCNFSFLITESALCATYLIHP